MIYALPEDEYGNRRVYTIDRHIELGEFNWENGRSVFYASSSYPFSPKLLESILNFQRTIDPCIS